LRADKIIDEVHDIDLKTVTVDNPDLLPRQVSSMQSFASPDEICCFYPTITETQSTCVPKPAFGIDDHGPNMCSTFVHSDTSLPMSTNNEQTQVSFNNSFGRLHDIARIDPAQTDGSKHGDTSVVFSLHQDNSISQRGPSSLCILRADKIIDEVHDIDLKEPVISPVVTVDNPDLLHRQVSSVQSFASPDNIHCNEENISERQDDVSSLDESSLESGFSDETNQPFVKRPTATHTEFAVTNWTLCIPQDVEEIPYDVDGLKKFVLRCENTKQMMSKGKDGRPWSRWCTSKR
jgi:hypothetical protein